METIEQRVNNVIVEQLGVSASDVKPASRFVNDLGADSLDVVELVMAIEDEFGLVISDEDSEKMVTPQSVYDYVNTNVRVPA